MQVIYDQEEKGDRQERRELLASEFRKGLRLFDQDQEIFGVFKLLSLGQDGDESEEVPLSKAVKSKKAEAKEPEEEKVNLRKPYEVLQVIEKGLANLDPGKDLE